jgi:hypothetical protein
LRDLVQLLDEVHAGRLSVIERMAKAEDNGV